MTTQPATTRHHLFSPETTRVVNTGPEIHDMLRATLEAGLIVTTAHGVITSIWLGPMDTLYVHVLEKALPAPLRCGESMVVAVTDRRDVGDEQR